MPNFFWNYYIYIYIVKFFNIFTLIYIFLHMQL